MHRLTITEEMLIPKFGTSESTGIDLYAAEDYEPSVFNRGGARFICKTGVYVNSATPCVVRPTSGNSLRADFDVQIGTIDSDYEGEVGVIMHAYSTIKKGQKIAQLVGEYSLFTPDNIEAYCIETASTQRLEVIRSSRGDKGYNSTGRTNGI